MGRLKISAGNALVGKKSSKLLVFLLSLQTLMSAVIIAKLYGLI